MTVEIPNSRSCHERNRKVGDKKKTVFSVKAPPLFLLCVSYQSQTNALLTCGGGIGEPNDGGGMGFNNVIYLRGQLERHRSNKTRCAVYRFKHTKGTQPNLKIHNSKVIHASIKRPEMVLIIPLRSKMMAVSRTCQPSCPTNVECCCRGGGIDFDFLSTSFDAFQIDTTLICASILSKEK